MTHITSRIPSYQEIFSSKPDESLNTVKACYADLEESKNALAARTIYTSREKLYEAGLVEKYDAITAEQLRINLRDSRIKAQQTIFSYQQESITKINEIVIGVTSNLTDIPAKGTLPQKVNAALQEISQVLKRVNPVTNQYVFGGDNPSNDPLSTINALGQRVPSDIVNNTNIVEEAGQKIAKNTYSDTAANQNMIATSSQHEIRENRLHPSMPAVVEAIGFLNMLKTPGPTDPAVTVQQRKYTDAMSSVVLEFHHDQKILEDSIQINALDQNKCNDALAEFVSNEASNLDMLTNRVSWAQKNLHIANTTTEVISNAQNDLLDMFRNLLR